MRCAKLDRKAHISAKSSSIYVLARCALRPRLGSGLWDALRARRLGVAFRRQVVVHGLIVEFFAPSVRLVVEVDGGYHLSRMRVDACRDRVLSRAGYRVLRLPAELVMRDLASAIECVRRALG
jgi:very-short-patch-repair endonuclease